MLFAARFVAMLLLRAWALAGPAATTSIFTSSHVVIAPLLPALAPHTFGHIPHTIRFTTQYSTTVNSPHAHITDRDIGRATRVHVSAVGRRVPLQYQQMRFGGRYQQMRFGGRLLLWVRIGLACRTMTTTPRAGGLHRAIVGARVPQTGTFPAASPRAACRRSTRAT